jgi:hypothetical protein
MILDPVQGFVVPIQNMIFQNAIPFSHFASTPKTAASCSFFVTLA